MTVILYVGTDWVVCSDAGPAWVVGLTDVVKVDFVVVVWATGPAPGIAKITTRAITTTTTRTEGATYFVCMSSETGSTCKGYNH